MVELEGRKQERGGPATKAHAYNPSGREEAGRVGGLGYSVKLLCLSKRGKEGGQERA